jgi:periplasmic protein CpxP/Spy
MIEGERVACTRRGWFASGWLRTTVAVGGASLVSVAGAYAQTPPAQTTPSGQAPAQSAPSAGSEGKGRHDKGGGNHWQQKMNRWLDQVKATPQQRQQIHAIMDRMGPQLQAVEKEREQDMERLTTALTSDTVDRSAIEQVRTEVLRTFDQTSRTLTQGLSDMAQVLTPQQRKQLGQILEQHKQERQRRMEEHRGQSPDGGK